jgi:predicted ATP-grasp superfamily ATP-dependent carboligase
VTYSAERYSVHRHRPTAPRSPHEQILVLGAYRPAVGVVRALARKGMRVVVGTEPTFRHIEGTGGAEFSRHAAALWRHPPMAQDGGRAFIDALVDESGTWPRPVFLLPMDETALVLLARERARLPAKASLVAPSFRVIETCLDKERSLTAAEAAGLAVPCWTVVRQYSELLQAVGDTAVPMVVKPLWPATSISGIGKALLCDDAGDLARQLPGWPVGHDRLLVQRRALGTRRDLLFAARDGELVEVVEVHTTRTHRNDEAGLAVAGRIDPVGPGRRDQLARIVAHLGYHGIGCCQFIASPGDPGGAFIELNPRFDANYVIVEQVGVDLAYLAIKLTTDRETEYVPAPSTPSCGQSYVWTFGELSGLLYSVLIGRVRIEQAPARLTGIAWRAMRAEAHVTWAWRDPLPALVTFWRHLFLAGITLVHGRIQIRFHNRKACAGGA